MHSILGPIHVRCDSVNDIMNNGVDDQSVVLEGYLLKKLVMKISVF